MADYDGDKTKQPPECKSEFIYFSEENPRRWFDDKNAKGYWTKCPHIKDGYSDFEVERYECDVCGKYYSLYYDDMK